MVISVRAERPGVGSNTCHCWTRGTRRFGKGQGISSGGSLRTEGCDIRDLCHWHTSDNQITVAGDTDWKCQIHCARPSCSSTISQNLSPGLGALVSVAPRDPKISSARDALSVTDCSPLHFCSLLLVALVFPTFKIANLEHVGFFPFFIKAVLLFFFLKKGVKLGFHSSTAQTIYQK